MNRAVLSPDQIKNELAGTPGWTLSEGALTKKYQFADFREAFGFMARAAMWAEKYDHHPDWTNVYNSVTVRLNTHDVGGITEFDFALARSMDKEAGPRA